MYSEEDVSFRTNSRQSPNQMGGREGGIEVVTGGRDRMVFAVLFLFFPKRGAIYAPPSLGRVKRSRKKAISVLRHAVEQCHKRVPLRSFMPIRSSREYGFQYQPPRRQLVMLELRSLNISIVLVAY